MASVTNVTIGATSTSILTAAMWSTLGGPVYLKNESDTIIVLTISSADTYELDPGEPLHVLPGQIVTGTAVGGSKKLQIIAGIVPADESAAVAASLSYDVSSGGDQVVVLNPPSSYVATQQEIATAQTDGTANDYYIDMEYYNEITIQIVDTPGVAGLNTYTIEASATNDGTAQASADYVDVGAALFGSATYVTSAFVPASKNFRAKFVHINVTRTADGANSDGAWTINILLGNS